MLDGWTGPAIIGTGAVVAVHTVAIISNWARTSDRATQAVDEVRAAKEELKQTNDRITILNSALSLHREERAREMGELRAEFARNYPDRQDFKDFREEIGRRLDALFDRVGELVDRKGK